MLADRLLTFMARKLTTKLITMSHSNVGHQSIMMSNQQNCYYEVLKKVLNPKKLEM